MSPTPSVSDAQTATYSSAGLVFGPAVGLARHHSQQNHSGDTEDAR
jgi:hypothetical protein